MSARTLYAGLLTGLVAVLSAPAAAGPVTPADFKVVGDKPDAVLDPAASYLIVHTPAANPTTFIRRPEPAEIEDYLARRAAALTKAHGKWEKKHATWAADAAAFDKSPADRRSTVRPKEPVEPTDANLAFAPIEQENSFTMGPFNRFAKGDGGSTYVQMVPPGRYVLYGSLYVAQAVAGTCLCMGSIEFAVGPGQIVDAGTLRFGFLDARERAKAEGKPVPKKPLDLPGDVGVLAWEPATLATARDSRLAKYTIVPADLHASGRVPNYYGIEIDRLTPIPGVLAYDRDTVVDVKTGKRLR